MVHGSFASWRPRHPLVRVALGVLGVFAALLLVTIGAVALALVGGVLLLVSAWRRASSASSSGGAKAAPRAPAAPTGIIEGEFRVVSTHSPERSTAAP